MEKKPTSFMLSDEAKELLKLIAIKQERSQAKSLEVLIRQEAEKLKIKLPKK
jgi:hypothetical protein